MSKIIKLRKGLKSELPILALGEMGLVTDENDVQVGGLTGNFSITKNPVNSKVHKGVVIGNRISISTGGKYNYEEGQQVDFYIEQDLVAPVTMVIDSGAELTIQDLDGNPIDVAANTVYISFYKDASPSPVFQSAPRGGGGGTVGSVTPILGKQSKTGSEIDKTSPLTVVGSAYDTGGNGGRKLVRLDNGDLIAVVKDPAVGLKMYKTSNNGDTWTVVNTNVYGNTAVNDWAIHAVDNDNVGVLMADGSANVYYRNVELSTGTNGTLTTVDSGLTALGNVSMAIAPNGDLHAAWSSRNASLPNSDNIRYSKSTNGGVTWDAPVNRTVRNASGTNVKNPSIKIDSLGNPCIIADYTNGSSLNTIQLFSPSVGTTWTPGFEKTLYQGLSFLQLNPSFDKKENEQLITTWQGYGDTHPSTFHVFFSDSNDNGNTWSTALDIAIGQNPSITRNSNDEVQIVYDRSGNLYRKTSADNFTAEELIGPGTNANTVSNYREFSKSLTLFDGGSDVKFTGKWGSFTINNIDLATVLKDSYIYCNEPTNLTLSGGGTQNIPSIHTATSESQLIAAANGILKTTGSIQKQYVGNVSKESLGFTPIT